MENAIKTADPDRWARYLLRRGQEAEAEEEERVSRQPVPAVPPAVEDGKADDDDDEDGWRELFEGLDMDEEDSGPPGSVGSSSAPSDLGAAVEATPAGQSGDLVQRLCSVDVTAFPMSAS